MSTLVLQNIDEQIGDLRPDEVEEIELDTIQMQRLADDVKKRLETYTNLASLTLNGCNLKSLENFPKLPNLIRLELIDNQLPGEKLKPLGGFQNLQSLSLGGNQINTVSEIQFLKALPHLFQLDLKNNKIADTPNYRKVIFDLFPDLAILDDLDKKGNQIQYSDSEGEGSDDEDGEEGAPNGFQNLNAEGDEDEDEEEDDDDEDEEEEEGEESSVEVVDLPIQKKQKK